MDSNNNVLNKICFVGFVGCILSIVSIFLPFAEMRYDDVSLARMISNGVPGFIGWVEIVVPLVLAVIGFIFLRKEKSIVTSALVVMAIYLPYSTISGFLAGTVMASAVTDIEQKIGAFLVVWGLRIVLWCGVLAFFDSLTELFENLKSNSVSDTTNVVNKPTQAISNTSTYNNVNNPMWYCESCNTANPNHRDTCVRCGRSK